MRRLPLVVPAVREREKKAVGTEAPARESSPCGLSASHDDAAHPSNAAPFVEPPKRLSKTEMRRLYMRDTCYLFDKPSLHRGATILHGITVLQPMPPLQA